MSVCINSCQSRLLGIDIVKSNHTVFGTADVLFIVSLTVATVKGSGRVSSYATQMPCLWARDYVMEGQENEVRIPTNARNIFYSSHLSAPIVLVLKHPFCVERKAAGIVKLTCATYCIN